MAAEFTSKSVNDFNKWLQEEGFNENIRKNFEGSTMIVATLVRRICLKLRLHVLHLENEVDGEGFLLLTDEDMADMVKPLGARRKLITKRNMLTCVSAFVARGPKLLKSF